jgi:hypothetical protein
MPNIVVLSVCSPVVTAVNVGPFVRVIGVADALDAAALIAIKASMPTASALKDLDMRTPCIDD